VNPLPHAWAPHSCLDLVNSRWQDHVGGDEVYDRLPLRQWRLAFLDHWGLAGSRAADVPEAIRRLERLRGTLRVLLEARSRGEPLPAREVAALNGVLAACPLTRRLEAAATGWWLVAEPPARDWRWAVAEVAASGARVLAEGDPGRLRVCANPSCSWMFYDQSRSGTRRWCEAPVCGSLVKVRAHRARVEGELAPKRRVASRSAGDVAPNRPSPAG
jgi:predicted RNA-binding Zn ribbon-like protein